MKCRALISQSGDFLTDRGIVLFLTYMSYFSDSNNSCAPHSCFSETPFCKDQWKASNDRDGVDGNHPFRHPETFPNYIPYFTEPPILNVSRLPPHFRVLTLR